MRKFDVLIVGSGLFGSMVAKMMQKQGVEYLLIDNANPLAASKCASGIWRNGWVEKIKPFVEQSLPVLEQLVGVDKKTIYNFDNDRFEDFEFIEPSSVLNMKPEKWTVNRRFFLPRFQGLQKGGYFNFVLDDEDSTRIEEIAAKHVVFCCGAFTDQLLIDLGFKTHQTTDSYWGQVVKFKFTFEQQFIKTWAPYKQLYGLNLWDKNDSEYGYFTNGSSVKNPVSLVDKRFELFDQRLDAQLDELGLSLTEIKNRQSGLRPYLKKQFTNQFITQHSDRVWSCTGGAKNSLVLSGYIAKQIFENIYGKN